MAVQMQPSVMNIKDGESFEKASQDLRSRYTLGDALPTNLASLSIMSPGGIQNESREQQPAGHALTKRMESVSGAITTEAYSIQPLTVEHHERALEHLRKYFFRDEPLNVNMGLLSKEDDRCIELEEYALTSMKKGVSLMANCVTEREDAATISDPSKDCANPKFAKILALLHHVSQEANVFGQFPDVQRVLNISILSVDSNWRGRGIARALTDATAEYAKDHAVQMLRVDCTSHFTALISERLGFHSIYSLPYAQYIKDGKPVFNPPPPHLEIKVFVHRVDEDKRKTKLNILYH
ncbi:dopamine N-acetyltransferase-like [Ctenocephalides felis]|uniref:dopamine N-acetyltransferase-like n=1 Tax=Ctenocephalides felis TaxID=7515 RepID=UPI000E6E19D5|nr:dopamine N-acetyltransferase-like [Ctenocephalides felis]